MDDTQIGTIPNPIQPPEVGLKKLHAIAGEYFDDYLVVVMNKDGCVWRAYKNKTTAYGMASKICHEINQDWWQSKNDKP